MKNTTTTAAKNNKQLDSLLEENMGLVVSLAKSFKPRDQYELDEFIQIGRIAAWNAINKHDPSRATLCTLIYLYVRWDILRYLNKNSNIELQFDEHSFLISDNITNFEIWEYLPKNLTNNEHKVLELRLKNYNFVDIGKELGYSRGWANNKFKSAIKKIKDANKEKTHINV